MITQPKFLKASQSVSQSLQWYMIYVLSADGTDASRYILFVNDALEWEQLKCQ